MGNEVGLKRAGSRGEAWDKQLTFDGLPHAWLQWKGSRVCMDLCCFCGVHSHVDAEFFCYRVKCPACGRVYECNGHVELIELLSNKGYENSVSPQVGMLFEEGKGLLPRPKRFYDPIPSPGCLSCGEDDESKLVPVSIVSNHEKHEWGADYCLSCLEKLTTIASGGVE